MKNETLYPFYDFPTELPLKIALAGITHPDAAYEVHRPKSKITVLEYVLSGKGFLFLEGKKEEVKAGQIYLLRRGVPHHYGCDPKDPYEKIFLNISGSFCDELLDLYALKAGVFEDPGVKEAFLQIPKLIGAPLPPEKIQSSLLGILMQVFSALALAKKMSAISPEGLKLKEYLDGNADRSVSAKELSEVIFRSPDYCRKLFLRSFGTTPYAYQLEQKIRRGKTLLSQTSLSVREIATLLGYDDPHYFSNLFLSKTGVRPLLWRKRKREE